MNALYLIYQVFIAFPLILVSTIINATIVIVGSIFFNTNLIGYYPGMIWSKVFCTIMLIPVEVVGKENIDRNKAYVFVANHQGIFDIFLLYGYLGKNIRWLMKKSLRRLPFVGKACESSGHIFVDRNSGPKEMAQTISRAKDIAERGISLAIFPEGSRTDDGQIKRFKKGAFQLAKDTNLQIVPITINGSFQVMPKTRAWAKWNRLRMTVHQPIEPSESIEETMSVVRQKIESELYV